MIRSFLSALALVLFAALPARAIDIQEVTSPGGITAWLVEDDSIPFVALEIAFKGGASVDAAGKRGAVNLMTAGKGIVHSERTPPADRGHDKKLLAIQTWLAQPSTLVAGTSHRLRPWAARWARRGRPPSRRRRRSRAR